MEYAVSGRRSDADSTLRTIFLGFAITFSCIATAINWYNAKHDYHYWYAAGQAILHGQIIYDVRPHQQMDFIYPPPAAYFMAPTTVGGVRLMTAIMVAANSIAWYVCLILSVYLATGGVRNRHPLLYIIPFALTLPYVWETYILGQPNMLLLACMMAGFAFLKRGQPLRAGAVIGMAASIKAFPLAAIGYLIYRRYWKAALAMVAAIIFFVVLLPAPFRGFDRNMQDFKTWVNCTFEYDSGAIGQRSDRSYSWQNQSLLGLSHRLLRHTDANRSREGEVFVNFVDLTFKQVGLVFLIVGGGMALAYMLLMPPRQASTDDTRAIEWAMLLILIMLASPYMFGYFNVWLMFPYVVLVDATGRARVEGRFPAALIPLIVCPILFIFSLQFRAFWYPQMLGNLFWGDLLILIALGWELWRRSQLIWPDSPARVAHPSPATHAG